MAESNIERGAVAGRDGTVVEYWRPLSWSAIIGGTVAALAIQLVLTMVGIGIGAAMIDPAYDVEPGKGAAWGALAWLILSGVVSFGLGGFVAGYMSGVLRTSSGALHGAVSWALAAAVGAIVAAMATSTTMGGAAAGLGASGAPNRHMGMWNERFAEGRRFNGGQFDMRDGRDGARPSTTDRFDNTATTAMPRALESVPVGKEDPAVEAAARSGARAMSEGREPTEGEALAMAEKTNNGIAKTALFTALAFALSALAAALGGNLGRTRHVDWVGTRR